MCPHLLVAYASGFGVKSEHDNAVFGLRIYNVEQAYLNLCKGGELTKKGNFESSVV